MKILMPTTMVFNKIREAQTRVMTYKTLLNKSNKKVEQEPEPLKLLKRRRQGKNFRRSVQNQIPQKQLMYVDVIVKHQLTRRK